MGRVEGQTKVNFKIKITKSFPSCHLQNTAKVLKAAGLMVAICLTQVWFADFVTC